MAMPLIIFKLGVILTITTFLAVFALKGLALLIMLIIMNIGGFFSKLALFKQDDGHKSQPIHVHVHGKGSYPSYHHSSIGHGYDDGWSDKNVIEMGPSSSDAERAELYNLHKRLGLTKYSEANSLYSSNDFYNAYAS